MSRSAVIVVILMLAVSSVEGVCDRDNATQEAQELEDSINKVRVTAASGELITNTETNATLPAAKNMNKLVWDCELESEAAKLIDQCSPLPTIAHIKETIDGYGWSFMSLYSEDDEKLLPITNMVDMMINTKGNLKFDDSDGAVVKFSGSPYQKLAVGDDPTFANLITAAATKVGCAVQKCGEEDATDYYVTALCLTDHRLESPDYDIYEIRQDEADCDCLTADAWCNPDTKLCEVTTTTTTESTTTSTTTTTTTPTTTTTTTPTTTTTTTTTPTTTTTTTSTTTTTTTPTTTTTTTTTTTPTTTTTTTPTTTTTTTPTTTTTTPAIQPSPNAVLPSSTAADTICPENYYMTDKLRLRILDMHNNRRSLLALGKVTKNTGAYLPAAANMRKLRYDCELEFSAIKFASQCPKIGSTEDTRVGQGENIYQLTETGVTSFEQAASKAVRAWWKVVQVYPSLGTAAKFRQTHVGTAITTFTQMAWAATQYLGCSVVNCSPFYTTVCRYSPEGNVVGETVYAPGDFCTACPPDTKCNAALYLCAP